MLFGLRLTDAVIRSSLQTSHARVLSVRFCFLASPLRRPFWESVELRPNRGHLYNNKGWHPETLCAPLRPPFFTRSKFGLKSAFILSTRAQPRSRMRGGEAYLPCVYRPRYHDLRFPLRPLAWTRSAKQTKQRGPRCGSHCACSPCTGGLVCPNPRVF